MKMRASIARALVTEPQLLLMDEPFAALDEITRFKLNNDLLSVWQELRRTVIFVTHSVFESVYLSQRIVVMTPRPGRVFAEIDIDAPYPRDERFRTSAEYAGFCRQVADALSGGQWEARHERPCLAHRLAGPGARGRRVALGLDRACIRNSAIRAARTRAGAGDAGRRCRAVVEFPAGDAAHDTPGLSLAAAGGVGLAILFNQSRLVEYSFYPFAVILQVTPIVAIAPLLLIYLPQPLAVLACAWIVAFFPVLANTTLGLNSIDHNLLALFDLYKASRWQVLGNLKLPSALPQILAGLRIAGGLSLIGAVVAEIAAGSAGAGSGLAYRIAKSGYRLNIPRMFAALLLLSLAGVAIFYALSAISYLALRRWHESAVKRER